MSPVRIHRSCRHRTPRSRRGLRRTRRVDRSSGTARRPRRKPRAPPRPRRYRPGRSTPGNSPDRTFDRRRCLQGGIAALRCTPCTARRRCRRCWTGQSSGRRRRGSRIRSSRARRAGAAQCTPGFDTPRRGLRSPGNRRRRCRSWRSRGRRCTLGRLPRWADSNLWDRCSRCSRSIPPGKRPPRCTRRSPPPGSSGTPGPGFRMRSGCSRSGKPRWRRSSRRDTLRRCRSRCRRTCVTHCCTARSAGTPSRGHRVARTRRSWCLPRTRRTPCNTPSGRSRRCSAPRPAGPVRRPSRLVRRRRLAAPRGACCGPRTLRPGPRGTGRPRATTWDGGSGAWLWPNGSKPRAWGHLRGAAKTPWFVGRVVPSCATRRA